LKKKQYISLLFLFAISLVLAHSIIPHHHYGESCVTNNCFNNQAIHGQSEKHSKGPWHCQAFNHVVLIEQQSPVKFRPFLSEQILPDGNQLMGAIVVLESETKYYTYFREPVTDPLVSLSPLRAPPALA
jgi:hypothetical protein